MSRGWGRSGRCSFITSVVGQLFSVMCYDQKANFSRDQAVFGQIASSFKFDEGSRYDPTATGINPRLVLVAVLTFAIVAVVVITIVVIAIRRRPAMKGA